MFALIRAGFNFRRKTLVNAVGLAGVSMPGTESDGKEQKKTGSVTKEQAAQALKACGLPENIRGEALTLKEFAAVADALING